MKIPVYTAQGQLQSTTPGRQIRARKSVDAAVQSEMAKAAPGMALTEAIGNYATTRYKIQTQNNLDEAMLDAQEALQERRRELAKSANYGKVLDGDDPIWDKETEQLKRDLLKKVGGDRYALQQFNSRFRQLEMQNRFSLRDSIDARIKMAANQNRKRKLENAEDALANGTDLADITFSLKDIVQDKERLAKIGAGNLDILTEQERQLLNKGAYRALEKAAEEAPNGVQFLEDVRKALRDEKTLTDEGATLMSPEKLYVYGLLKMLNPNDQARIMKSVGGDQTFLEGPTAAEKLAMENQKAIAEQFSKSYAESIDVRMDEIAKGNVQSEDQMLQLQSSIEQILPSLEPAARQALTDQYNDLNQLNSLQKGISRSANLKNIDSLIASYENGIPGRNLSGKDTIFEQKALKLFTDYKEVLKAQLAPDGDAITLAKNTKMDNVRIQPLDLTLDGVINDAATSAREGGITAIQNRIQQGLNIQALNGLDYTPFLSKEESQNVLDVVTANGLQGAAYLKTLLGSLDNKSSAVLLENLRRSGLPSEYIQAMYVDDPKVMQDIIGLIGRSTDDLKAGLPQQSTTGSTGVSQVLRDSGDLQKYRAAYLSGGDGAAAEEIFNEQYQMAERLAYSYLKDGKEIDAAKAVNRAFKNVFQGTPIVGPTFSAIIPTAYNQAAVTNSANALISEQALRKFDIIPLSDPRYGYYENIEVNIASLADTAVWLNNGTGDGLRLHYNLNGTYVPVQLNSETSENRYLDVKFDVLSKLDAKAAINAQFGLTPKSLSQFATGFKGIVSNPRTDVPGSGTQKPMQQQPVEPSAKPEAATEPPVNPELTDKERLTDAAKRKAQGSLEQAELIDKKVYTKPEPYKDKEISIKEDNAMRAVFERFIQKKIDEAQGKAVSISGKEVVTFFEDLGYKLNQRQLDKWMNIIAMSNPRGREAFINGLKTGRTDENLLRANRGKK